MDPVPDLAPLLSGAPARILLLGWPEAVDGPGGAAREVHRVAESGDLDPESALFDAVLWHGKDSREDTAAVVARLRQCLRDDGQLIVVVPLSADATTATRHQGSLPSRHQERLREIVRLLSEAGFAIRKDENRRAAELPADGVVDWKILVARRDRFHVRPYRDGDEQEILRLFRASFHLDRSLDHWRWKYAENPWSGYAISLAAGAGGELAAHYGGYPMPFWCADERGRRTFLAVQLGDIMTDPAVRSAVRSKGGLLARTVRHFFSVHRDGTFGWFYGFVTGTHQRFCRWFIGGSQDRPVRYLDRGLEPAPGWRPGGYRIERIEAVGAAWDRFFRRVAPSYRFLVRRDARYLDWRYLKRPDARYLILAAWRFRRLVGWSVFLRRDDRIAWGDALFDPRHLRAVEPILAAALVEPELAGARRIEAWFSGGPPRWNERLAALGFTVRPEPQGLGMIALADGEPEAFDKLGEMYTTMGDGDLF